MKKIMLLLLLVGCIQQTPQSQNGEYAVIRDSMAENITCLESNYGCACCNNNRLGSCNRGQSSSFFSMPCPLAKELGIKVLTK